MISVCLMMELKSQRGVVHPHTHTHAVQMYNVLCTVSTLYRYCTVVGAMHSCGCECDNSRNCSVVRDSVFVGVRVMMSMTLPLTKSHDGVIAIILQSF
jgi:hypothetical protein